MPKPPGLVDKVNGIISFIENPCDAPWYIYLETLLPPTGDLILALLSFGMDDVVRGFFRPKGLRGLRHGRRGPRGGKKGRGRFSIPEVGEMIGEHLPGAELAKDRPITDGLRYMWLLDGVIQRALWYWMVVDLTATFFYDWTSLINRSTFCSNEGNPRALRRGGGGGALGIQSWVGVECPELVYEHGGIVSTGTSFDVPSGIYSCQLGLEARNIGSGQHTLEMGIFDDPLGFFPIGSITSTTIAPGGLGSLVASASFTGPRTVHFLQRVNSGASVGERARAYCQGHARLTL